ncbi:MAG: dihydrofolate reductase family protein, partial [Mariprofundaceae bacterium]|nr:dihydrofolate reductase family protein [Mariprofundaceae bacterium]
MHTLNCLFPQSGLSKPLRGLYLACKLHQEAVDGDVLMYSNYIASLDGRIALHDSHSHEFAVPKSIANDRDWRLYQELAAQSDIMLTSARYFRQLAKGCAQDLLPVGKGKPHDDLHAWRKNQKLSPQPDVMIVSSSLDIPLESLAYVADRKIWVITTSHANKERKRALEAVGAHILIGGKTAVQGDL